MSRRLAILACLLIACGQDSHQDPAAPKVAPQHDVLPILGLAANKDEAYEGTALKFTTTLEFAATLSYAWDFSDGTTLTTNKLVQNHKFADEGDYEVSVTGSGSGSTTSAFHSVTILNAKPKIMATYPAFIESGDDAPISVTVTDPGVHDEVDVEVQTMTAIHTAHCVTTPCTNTYPQAVDGYGKGSITIIATDNDGAVVSKKLQYFVFGRGSTMHLDGSGYQDYLDLNGPSNLSIQVMGTSTLNGAEIDPNQFYIFVNSKKFTLSGGAPVDLNGDAYIDYSFPISLAQLKKAHPLNGQLVLTVILLNGDHIAFQDDVPVEVVGNPDAVLNVAIDLPANVVRFVPEHDYVDVGVRSTATFDATQLSLGTMRLKNPGGSSIGAASIVSTADYSGDGRADVVFRFSITNLIVGNNLVYDESNQLFILTGQTSGGQVVRGLGTATVSN